MVVDPYLRSMRVSLFHAAEYLDVILKKKVYNYESLLVDKRDSIFVVLSVFIASTVIPSACFLFLYFSYLHAVLHVLLVMVVYAETFMAMLHNASHRPIYRSSLLNCVIPYLLCPFFGQTWNTYYYHHVKHHHVEDNGALDLSSTAQYQRDSIAAFLLYFLRFFFLIQTELPLYFVRKGRYALAIQAFASEISSLSMFTVSIWYWGMSGFAVFLVPFMLFRFFMMAANWGQHAFINSSSSTAHSLTIIGSSYNVVAFNDGFHASHHHNSKRHWSEHPNAAISLKTVTLDSITLRGDLNFGDVWLLLMTKNFARLEELVIFSDETNRPPKETIIAELKRQLQPVKCA